MPLTQKGKKILQSMQDQYGKDKGKSVFYASINKGTITKAEKKAGELDTKTLREVLSKEAQEVLEKLSAPRRLKQFASGLGLGGVAHKLREGLASGEVAIPEPQDPAVATLARLKERTKILPAVEALANRIAPEGFTPEITTTPSRGLGLSLSLSKRF